MRRQEARRQEAPLSLGQFNFFNGLHNIPKAELNVVLGFLLVLIFSCFSANKLAFGVFCFSVYNYLANEKPAQDALVRQYLTLVGPTGFRNSGAGSIFDDGEIQGIFKGLTHPLFREKGRQKNVDVINNAVATRL